MLFLRVRIIVGNGIQQGADRCNVIERQQLAPCTDVLTCSLILIRGCITDCFLEREHTVDGLVGRVRREA